MNSVFIRGNLTRNPELKVVSDTLTVVNFGIAYNHYSKTKTEQEVSFFECKAFGKLAEYIARSIQKGDRVAIEGTIKQERFEHNGAKKERVSIACRSVDKLAKIEKNGENSGNVVDPEEAF